MYVALNLALLTALILTAGLGGYILAKAKHTAILDRRSAAYRGQITRLRRSAAAAEEVALRANGDLDRARRRIRTYERALYAQSVDATAAQPAPQARAQVQPQAQTRAQPQAQPQPKQPVRDTTARYDMPDIREAEPSGHLDGEVLKDVKKTVDIDRFRINVVRREIA